VVERHVYGTEHPDVAINLNNLAGVNIKNGEFDEAEANFTEAIAIMSKLYGEDHPKVAVSLNNMSVLYKKTDRYDKSVEVCLEALEIAGKKLPEGHWLNAIIMSNLADCLIHMQQYPEAENYLMQSYPILTANFGEEHDRSMQTLEFIIELYKAWDKPEKLEEYRLIQIRINDEAAIF
jgi:tetratricopeptide (TPR) repeat protein